MDNAVELSGAAREEECEVVFPETGDLCILEAWGGVMQHLEENYFASQMNAEIVLASTSVLTVSTALFGAASFGLADPEMLSAIIFLGGMPIGLFFFEMLH